MITPEENSIIDLEEQKKSGRGFFRFFKKFFLFILLVIVILASFWVSFQLGKRILIPVKETPGAQIGNLSSVASPEIYVYEETEEKQDDLVVSRPERKTVIKKSLPSKVWQSSKYYKVIAGKFNSKAAAINLVNKLNIDGVATYLKKIDSSWRVQVGAFRHKKLASSFKNLLAKKGYQTKVVYE